MQELTILPDIESLLPPLSEEEFETLKENVLAEGIRDAIVIWNGTVIDGHHRYRLAREFSLPFETREMTFDSLNDAKLWIIKNQSGRRNMTLYARTALALKLKEVIAEKAKARQARKPKDFVPQNSAAQNNETRDQIAQIADTSRDTVSRVEFIEQNADEETKEQLRRGDVSINKVYNQLKNETFSTIETESDTENIPEPVEPTVKIDEALLHGKPANPRERCVTLQRISVENPESIISVLFDIFDEDYREKFAEMFMAQFLHEKEHSEAEAFLTRLIQNFR